MIAEIIEGKGVYGALRYCERKPGARLIAGNVCGIKARDIAREFGLYRQLRPNLHKACRHIPIAFPPLEREISDDDLAEMAFKYLHRLGFRNTPYVVYRHVDAGHPHLHIVTMPITFAGKTIREGHTRLRSQKVCQDLEAEYQLVLAPRVKWEDPRIQSLGRYGLGYTRHLDGQSPTLPPQGRFVLAHMIDAKNRAPKIDNRLRHREVQVPQQAVPGVAELLREAIRRSMELQPRTLADFGFALQGHGTHLHLYPDGKIRYELGDGRGLWASQTGKTYSLQKLQKVHGISFVPERDLPRLQPPRTYADAANIPLAPGLRSSEALPPAGRQGDPRVDALIVQQQHLKHSYSQSITRGLYASLAQEARHVLASLQTLPLPHPRHRPRVGADDGWDPSGPILESRLPPPGRLGLRPGGRQR